MSKQSFGQGRPMPVCTSYVFTSVGAMVNPIQVLARASHSHVTSRPEPYSLNVPVAVVNNERIQGYDISIPQDLVAPL